MNITLKKNVQSKTIQFLNSKKNYKKEEKTIKK
jgi:hypothetical protein